MAKITADNAQLDSYIEQLAKGDREAFELLYLAIKGSVFPFALSVLRDYQLAEDALQESLIAIAKTAPKYQLGTNPKAWIFSVVRNTCVNIQRGLPRGTVPLAEVDEALESPVDVAQSSEEKNMVEEALQVLSQQEREIVFLFLIEGLKQTEIAAILHLPYGKVRSKYKYALQKMKKHMKQGGNSTNEKDTIRTAHSENL